LLYLGIDQHSKQLTVRICNEAGETVLSRQVSTRPKKIAAFLEEVRQIEQGYSVILEVCGFNDWLIETLRQTDCQDVVLIHPDRRSKRKTDRRDANKLCEMLWMNRDRLARGEKLRGIRRVYIATREEREKRRLTASRKRVGEESRQQSKISCLTEYTFSHFAWQKW